MIKILLDLFYDVFLKRSHCGIVEWAPILFFW